MRLHRSRIGFVLTTSESDNCNGEDFYYQAMERILEAIRFWGWSYDNEWFVRWSLSDKTAGCGWICEAITRRLTGFKRFECDSGTCL